VLVGEPHEGPRLWPEEGLQRPTPRMRKRAPPADCSVRRHRAEHPHQVWAMDFQFDATADGCILKFLSVIDEHSRFCLAIRVGRRCKAKDVVTVLEELTSVYPAPTFIRSDNGPEFIAKPYGTGARPVTQPARSISSLDLRGRTALPNRSTDGSGMSSSSPSCSPRVPRLNCWLIAGAGNTTHSGLTRLSRGVRPWRQLNRELPHVYDHPLS
jgi:transposase InsO family protein